MSLVDDANSLPQILKGFYTAPSGPTEALWQELSRENSSFCNINTKKHGKKHREADYSMNIQFGEVEHHNPFFVGLLFFFFFRQRKGESDRSDVLFWIIRHGAKPEATER